MVKPAFIISAWLGIFALAAFLRLDELAERPMHADEATGARILANRIEADTYTFDPKHFHGPLLSVTSEPIARLAGEDSWKTLTKQSLRVGPVLAGLLLVLCPLLWIRFIGTWGALTAGSLLATSPLLVYYNRMYIHESLLLLFAMLTLPIIFRLARRPTYTLALLAGLGTGLMFATKETFAISMLAWACACLVHFILNRGREDSPAITAYILPAALVIFAALFSAAFFYSNGFRSIDGMINAIKTYFVYETTPGHEKAFSYYLELLLWPKHQLGIYWSEAFVGILAICSAAFAYIQKSRRTVVAFLAVATLAHFAIYSAIGYKTPWLMLVPWAHACLLAGIAMEATLPRKKTLRYAAIIVLILGLGYQTKQSIHATGNYANDARNPYAYVPTSKDTEVLKNWLTELSKQQANKTLSPLAVIGNGYWPLPWYLKDFDTIGYWSEVDPSAVGFSMVFSMPDQNHEVANLLSNSHTALPRSLRAEVPVILYLRNDLWNKWIHSNND
ncbi:MAG: flippase activity-associated protein Agl23 [Opitutaceae bacterium]